MAQSFSDIIMSSTPTLVDFYADWCGPCKIVEPNLDRAMRNLNDPSLKVVMIDVTDSPRIQRSAHLAFDHNIAKQYNQWYGVTGFAAMIDADTKNTLGCVDMRYDSGSMTAHIRNLKTYAVANKPSFDVRSLIWLKSSSANISDAPDIHDPTLNLPD